MGNGPNYAKFTNCASMPVGVVVANDSMPISHFLEVSFPLVVTM